MKSLKVLTLLLALPSIALSSGLADSYDWLKVACHDEKEEVSLSLELGMDQVRGTRDILTQKWGSEIYKGLRSDGAQNAKPDPGIAYVSEKEIEILARYYNGLMWDTYVRIKMNKQKNHWHASVLVEGDEGEYLKRETKLDCQISSGENIYSSTNGFKQEKMQSVQ